MTVSSNVSCLAMAGGCVRTVACGGASAVWSFVLPNRESTGSVSSAAKSLSITVGLRKWNKVLRPCTTSMQSGSCSKLSGGLER